MASKVQEYMSRFINNAIKASSFLLTGDIILEIGSNDGSMFNMVCVSHLILVTLAVYKQERAVLQKMQCCISQSKRRQGQMLSKILSTPTVYAFFQKLIVKEGYSFFFEHKPDIRVLDIGCGPATCTHYFLDTDYMGIDLSEEYIQQATQKYEGHRNIKFLCSDANIFLNSKSIYYDKFDLIIMCGVLHHLDDTEVNSCLSSLPGLLSSKGIFRSLDGVFINNQSKLAKLVLRSDRGKYVRTIKGYRNLVCKHFPEASYTVYNNLLRVPATHIKLEYSIGNEQ